MGNNVFNLEGFDLERLAWRRLREGDLDGAICMMGRNDAPRFLDQARDGGLVDDSKLRSVLLDVWCMAEFPLRCLPRWKWLMWYRTVGFVTEGLTTPKPEEPIELWRAQVGRTIGLSWTQDRDVAEWFHQRNLAFGFAGRMLHCYAQPSAVLALALADDGRKEREVIIDPRNVKRAVWTRPQAVAA